MNPGDGPESYPLATYAWVIVLSVWGGVANFLRKCREGKARAFNIVEFIGEVVSSALAGLITFFLAESSHINQVMTAAMVAVSGHMGTRLLFHFERMAEEKLRSDK